MPTQREIKKIAKKTGQKTVDVSKQIFGHMRKMGWRPKSEGGPTKAWGKPRK